MKFFTFSSRLAYASMLTLFFVFTPVLTHATVYYVDAGQPDDTGDGLSWPTAMKQIQTAIDSSAVLDTILVKYGTYTLTTDLVLTSDRRIISDDGTHNSWSEAVYADSLCIIDADATGRVMTITGTGVSTETIIRGFKITGGRATGESPGVRYGGGIFIGDGAVPSISFCWITQNTATTSSTGYGGGIACRGSGTELHVGFCRIDYNLGSSSWYGYGGGIYCDVGTSLSLSHTEIRNNTASSANAGFGGGIYSNQSTLTAGVTWFTHNVAASNYSGNGGGIYAYRGDVSISSCSFRFNQGGQGNSRGGGIRISGSGNTTINRCYIKDNVGSSSGPGYGGGIYCDGGYTEISMNDFEDNVAAREGGSGYGGGLYLITYDENLVWDNEFLRNTASQGGTGWGGGIYTNTDIEIDRNIIAYNVASDSSEGYGGACYFTNLWSQVFTNNTVYRNANTTGPFGSGTGSGLYHNASGSGMTIDNNIFAGHSVEHSDSLAMYIPGPVTARYTCFYDNPGGNYSVNVTSINEVLADPRFTEPSDTTADFSLLYDSPCIEAGDPAYPLLDYHYAWVIDLGAIEYDGFRHLRTVTGTGELLFGGYVKAKVNVTTLGTLSEIDMILHNNDQHPMAPRSVERWYEINSLAYGMTFDLSLSYYDRQLGNIEESDLIMWRWSGLHWDGPKMASVDTLENIATVFGQTALSDWILTDQWGPVHAAEIPMARTWLFPNYPNPFNPTTKISYQLSRTSHVSLVIYNVAGQIVHVLENAERPGGYYHVVWDGRDMNGRVVASGVYFYRLEAGQFSQTKKMVLIK